MNKELLIKAGLNKDEATVVSYMLTTNKTTFSRDLEHDLRLRQPVVSIVMNKLEDIGWVKYNKKRLEGKGRPEHEYSLNKSKNAIVRELIKKLNEEKKEIESTVNQLQKSM